MRFEEKLRREMILQGLNQQKLARLSGVSDSEVSRILGGKSQPGLENALKLARAIGVSLDYLADDSLDKPSSSRPGASPWEAEVVDVARQCGLRESAQLLLAARTVGLDVALRRLFGLETPPPPASLDAAQPAPTAAKDGAAAEPVATRRRRG
jgi:transcriptional regulator with XRE-family HTH domain